METDFHENSNLQIEVDSEKCTEPLALLSLKPMKNVKCEIDEESEIQNNASSEIVTSELIHIISEGIVNQHTLDDVKQPQIEIISENFNEKQKSIDLLGIENNETCDIKVIPETLLRLNDNNGQELEVDFPSTEVQPINFIEIKEPICESEEELITYEIPTIEKKNLTFSENVDPVVKPSRKYISKRKLTNSVSNEYQIDEKYLTLADGETCNIDMEEVEAVIRKKQDPNTKFHCDKCKKSFKFFKSLRKHKHWHDSQPEIFVCDICRKENIKCFEFSSLKSLNSHIQRKHMPLGGIKFECQICHRNMQSQGQLNAHFRKVHNNSEASCQICSKKFKNK